MAFDETQFIRARHQLESETPKSEPFLIESDTFLPTPEEEILANREIVSQDRLMGSGGENVVHFLKFKDDGAGIFKPQDGESEGLRDNTPAGTFYRRERAAYLVDRFLGFDLVPPTVIREIDGEVGSVQKFIPDAATYVRSKYRRSPETRSAAMNEQILKMFIFDHLIYNSDRHLGNFLISDNNQIHAIDNGLSFSKECVCTADAYQYSHKFNCFDQQLPDEMIEKFKTILADTAKQKELDKLLRELLPDTDRKAFFARLNRIGKLIVEDRTLFQNKTLKIKKFN